MAIYDIPFPLLIGEGTTGGPGHQTRVDRTESGMEVRQTDWDDRTSRVQYHVQVPPMTADEVGQIVDFIRGMRGPWAGWKLLDPGDWSTNPGHNAMPISADAQHRQPLEGVVGQNRWQMVKDYEDDEGLLVRRKITRPIPPHNDAAKHLLFIFFSGIPIYASIAGAEFVSAPGTKVAVEFATGAVWIDPAPPTQTMEWLGTYYTPAIMDPAVDSGVDLRWSEAGQWQVGNLRVQSIPVDYSEGPEGRLMGGSGFSLTASGGNTVSVSVKDGAFQRFKSQGGGQLFVRLPDLGAFIPDMTGGPWFQLWLDASAGPAIVVIDHNSNQIATTVAAGTQRQLEVSWAGGALSGGVARTWHMR